MTAQHLEQTAAHDIAAHYRIAMATVHDRLDTIPREMIGLYGSPFGWTVLGEYVAAALCIEGRAPFMPTVH